MEGIFKVFEGHKTDVKRLVSPCLDKIKIQIREKYALKTYGLLLNIF